MLNQRMLDTPLISKEHLIKPLNGNRFQGIHSVGYQSIVVEEEVSIIHKLRLLIQGEITASDVLFHKTKGPDL